MCKNVFNQCGSCENNGCQSLPTIDWSKATFRVTHPDADWIEERAPLQQGGFTGGFLSRSPRIVIVKENGSTEIWAYVGTSITSVVLPSVHILTHVYHFRGGSHYALLNDHCQWITYARERLCPRYFAVATVNDNGTVTLVSPEKFCDEDPWGNAHVIFVPNKLNSWRTILKALECEFIPAQEAKGNIVDNASGIEGGAIFRLNNARAALADPETFVINHLITFADPTPMDLAVAWTLDDGFEFGFVSDKESPLFGQFAIRTGGEFDGNVLQSTVYQPTAPLSFELGHVNRFERTDDNRYLPEWVEIELTQWTPGDREIPT